MRRRERQIEDTKKILQIVRSMEVCRLAMVDPQNNEPYIVCMNFGLKELSENGPEIQLYFHCAKSGRKTDILKHNPRVCFEMDNSHRLVKGEEACNWSMKFQSVVGYGIVHFIDDEGEKKAGLDLLMKQYDKTGEALQAGEYEYSGKWFMATRVLRLDVENLACKENG